MVIPVLQRRGLFRRTIKAPRCARTLDSSRPWAGMPAMQARRLRCCGCHHVTPPGPWP